MRTSVLATSLRVGFETLRANPLRTILSTLGIIIGVAALVSVLSVGDGMERLARSRSAARPICSGSGQPAPLSHRRRNAISATESGKTRRSGSVVAPPGARRFRFRST